MVGMQRVVILLVENDRDDAMLVAGAFRQLHSAYRLLHVSDGRIAMNYILGLPPYGDRNIFPTPRMILLDLKMPDVDGFQFLQWLRSQPGKERLSVVVLTGSVYSEDIRRAYSLGANSFIVKPVESEKLIKELELALDYWAPVERKTA